MDDTSRRVGPTADDPARLADEVRGRSGEAARNYAGGAAADVRSGSDDQDVDRRTRQIRRDIEHTREDMGETIDALQEKLRPSHLMSEATQRVKDATSETMRDVTKSASDAIQDAVDYGREAAGDVIGEVRQNAIPAILVGVGAAWWLLNETRSDGGRWDNRNVGREDRNARAYGYGVQESYGRPSGMLDRLTANPLAAALAAGGVAWLAMGSSGHRRPVSRGGGNWPPARERQNIRRSHGGDEASWTQVSESATQAATQVQHYAGDVSSRAQAYAGEAGEQLRVQSRRARNQLQHLMETNPALVGIGALAAGAAIGMALPETDHENEWLGDARNDLIERAGETVTEGVATAKQAAADMVGDVARQVVGGKKE